MFIRTTPTRNSTTGETYITHRLVESRRVGGKVRQVTLLNLGRHFPLAKERWPDLCARLEQLLSGQQALMPMAVMQSVERYAQHCFARLVAQGGAATSAGTASAASAASPAAFVEVDPDSLEFTQPRSIGVEHVALAAMRELAFEPLLDSLGINGVMRTAIVGSIIARMAAPGSELAAHRWLTGTSGLGDLLEVDLAALPLSRLYRASDLLMKHREEIETRLFARIETLFALEASVTLYDLTNTYFEGAAAANPKAARGRSKEKRSDCPLLTLGVVCDGSGFIRRSRVFAGNALECRTLEGMLIGLAAPAGALVIMDRGIATVANLAWLVEHGYRYLVVSRERERRFDADEAIDLVSAGEETIQVVRELSEDALEVRLHCHSPGRAQKETGIMERFCTRFEAGLTKLANGLTTPRGEKRPDRLQERIGRLKAASRGAGQHYTVTLETDAVGKAVTALRWEKTPVPGTMLTDPGVYCLRSNELSWDAARLWRTYMMLTDLEAVFRSLKGELGLRPIFHSKEERSDGHLFISVLAYQFVQTIRQRLRAHGIHDSWASLREVLAVQPRVTASFVQKDGRTLHVRKPTRPEPDLVRLYDALGLAHPPGGVQKLIS
ncbi:MAG: IS1634 family transposase [Sterolibacteriaceae bacterium]|uniref:IS1634 family transposase n=1 Tax=Candidatus Methylophosphatis roskildensis TaxID=2899263 RepID=A0A9D7E7C6_9PROT|nr:IS1634 family transposase [Candidatus Methylophosphatis roskildensis]